MSFILTALLKVSYASLELIWVGSANLGEPRKSIGVLHGITLSPSLQSFGKQVVISLFNGAPIAVAFKKYITKSIKYDILG